MKNFRGFLKFRRSLFYINEPTIKAMKKVTIQHNEFLASSTATTQEDNHGGILDRWDLFVLGGNGTLIGKLVKYYKGGFAVFHAPGIRYDIDASQVKFI